MAHASSRFGSRYLHPVGLAVSWSLPRAGGAGVCCVGVMWVRKDGGFALEMCVCV